MSKQRITVILALTVFGCGGTTDAGTSDGLDGGAAGGAESSGDSSTGGTAGSGAGGSRAGATGDGGRAGGTGGRGSGGAAGGQGDGGAAGATPGNGGGGGALGRVPANHRSSATACDSVRPEPPPGAPGLDASGPPVECRSHAECTNGTNGRCSGNGHDGWHCTYDACFEDADCVSTTPGGMRVCECEGGFRSDNNACLSEGNCRTDADCGAGGYCSPTFGMCGMYTGVVSYYCHTPEDQCIDDSDCTGDAGPFGASYCAYSPAAGRWQCSNSHCVG